MERAPDLAALASSPPGHYFVGRSWIHFCAHAELYGVVFFGRPDRDDMEALVRSLLVELGPGVLPHRSLVDARRLAGVDAGAFEVLHVYVRENKDKLTERVSRLALVRPEGMEGAVVTGFYGVLESPYPVQVVNEAREGLAWLGEPPSSLSDELQALVDESSGVPRELGALRALLAANLELAADEACRSLGLSERTLQRRLTDAGTSFQKEVLAARLREAERRMLDSDDPLTSIALDVGFASLQHFSQIFRKATGDSPSTWRSKRRGTRSTPPTH